MSTSKTTKSSSISAGKVDSTGKTESVEESLHFMQRLDQRFDSIASRVLGLDKLIEDGKLTSLQAASSELAKVIVDLKDLKTDEDKYLGESNSKGKPFRRDVDSLLEKTIALSKNLDSAISHYSNSVSGQDSKLSQSPLQREEIAKLLLLTAKSFQLNRINLKQKGHIKDQICRRQAYLRLILQQDDIVLLLGALSAVAGDP